MVLTADQQRVKTLLTETITLLCKNGLHFQSKFCIEGLIGITLDEGDVFLVSINETFHTLINDNGSSEQVSSHPVVKEPLNFHRIDKKRRRSPSTSDPLMQVESNAPGLSNSSCEDAVQGQIILSRSAVSCVEQPSDGKSSGFSQFANGHNLQDVSFKEEVVEGGNSDSLRTLTIQEASRKTNEFTVCADQNEAPAVQEAVEPVRKRPLTDGKDSDKKSLNKNGRSQSFSSGISCDQLSRSDGEVIHIKEETASDEDLAQSESLSYDYLSLYGVDVGQGCSAPTVTAVPLSDKSPRLSLPGCSTWSRQNSWEQSTSHNLQTQWCGTETFSTCSSGKTETWKGNLCTSTESTFLKSTTSNGGLEELHSDQLEPSRSSEMKRYPCPFCEKRFSATSNLRGHLVHHTGIKEFVCSICNKEFQYKQAMQRHMFKCIGIKQV